MEILYDNAGRGRVGEGHNISMPPPHHLSCREFSSFEFHGACSIN